MKRILALILSIALFGCGVALANADYDTMLISEEAETQEFVSDKRIVEGTVKAVGEKQIELDDIVLNLDANTFISDTDLVPCGIEEGDLVTAVVSTMTTRSLPPQSYAFYIIVRKNADAIAPIHMTVDKVENGFIYSQDGNYEVSFENAEVSMYRTKNIVKAEELTKGSEIFVYADMLTMSIPALVNPNKIVIMNIASDEVTEDIVSEEKGKIVVEGTVKSVSDGNIELYDYVLGTDENTLIAGTDLIPAQVKEGDMVTVVITEAPAIGIRPSGYAHYVIVRKNAEDYAPIYMTVDKVEEGFIYSHDGNYKVSFENAEVGMYKTKNIVKAEELTNGSEIFVYTDMMTMSIPALVNPNKIVIMNIAEVELDKAKALNEEGILLGTENGLELEREVTRSEAVTLIQRTTQSNRKAYTCDFADVDETHWAYNYIGWAVEEKIVEGVGDNKFEPDRCVTAKELAMMLLNAQGENVEFDKAFEVAVETGLVEEIDGISKDDILSRDAVAKMIYNYYMK